VSFCPLSLFGPNSTFLARNSLPGTALIPALLLHSCSCSRSRSSFCTKLTAYLTPLDCCCSPPGPKIHLRNTWLARPPPNSSRHSSTLVRHRHHRRSPPSFSLSLRHNCESFVPILLVSLIVGRGSQTHIPEPTDRSRLTAAAGPFHV
jgi:hypothetical protein